MILEFSDIIFVGGIRCTKPFFPPGYLVITEFPFILMTDFALSLQYVIASITMIVSLKFQFQCFF